MKKATTVSVTLICVVLLMTSMACTAAATEKINLRASTWLADQTERNHYDRWAEEFMEEHPNVNVEVDIPATAYGDKIVAESVAGNPPDLIRLTGDTLWNWARQGILMPFRDEWMQEIDFDELLPVAIESGTFEGKFYGWDTHMSAHCLHYNKDAFDQMGLFYPNEEWTWQEMAARSRKLTKKASDGTFEQYGVIVPEVSRTWYTYVWTLGGKIFADDGTPLFPSDEGLEALTYMYDLSWELEVAPQMLVDGRGLFFEARTAMLIDGVWMNPYFSDSSAITPGTAVMPHAVERATVAVPCLWAISSQTKHPQMAWELYKFWVGKEHGMEFCDFGGERAYGIPVWKSALTDSMFRPIDTLVSLVQMAEYMRPVPAFPMGNAWQLLGDAVYGKISPKEALIRLREDTLAVQEREGFR